MAQFCYIVDDVDKAAAFYTGHFGFDLEQQLGPAMAMLHRGDMALWLAVPVASASKPMPDGAQPAPGGWNRIVISVDDLAALVTTLREDGIEFRDEILAGTGGQQILRQDPSGNPIELF